MNKEDLIDLLDLRKWSYYFFSINFLNKPDWKEISKTENMKILKSIYTQTQSKNLKIVLDNLETIGDRKINLELDYERLFLAGESVLLSPWRSTYVGKEAIIFDENTLAIREKYREYGLAYTSKDKEPDDHISGIFEFMIYLIDMCISQVDKEDLYIELINEQKGFLEDFILDWIKDFNRQLESKSNEAYYKALSSMMDEFLVSDIKIIDEYLSI